MPRTRAVAERFWEKVEMIPFHTCWEWIAGLYNTGYGQFMVEKGQGSGAHRVAWELTHGPVPAGQIVMHRCDNRSCVNPNHLLIGTYQDNSDDMCGKGRNACFPGETNTNATLTNDQAEQIRQEYGGFRGHPNQRELADKYGVSIQAVSRIIRDESYV